jgi:hypothetical protein
LILLLWIGSCSSPRQQANTEWTPQPASDLGAAVAKVGGVPIFASQVLAEAKQTGKSARAALEALVELNLLAGCARGVGERPADSSNADVKSALVQRLLEKEMEPTLRPEAIPDSALRPLYERFRDGFVHPRLVEIGVLAIYTGSRMADSPRKERAETAKDLSAFLEKHPPKTLDEVAALASETSWSQKHVVFARFFQGLDRPLSKFVGIEVAKLHAAGETTPMVADEDGFFIARYIGERPPENVSFEQARDGLRAGYAQNWPKQRFLDFSGQLLRRHKVEAHFDLLTGNDQGL